MRSTSRLHEVERDRVRIEVAAQVRRPALSPTSIVNDTAGGETLTKRARSLDFDADDLARSSSR